MRNFTYVRRKRHARRPCLRNIRPGWSIFRRLPASIAIFQRNTRTAGHIAYAVSMKSVLYPPIPRLESGFVLVARSRSGAERHILPAERICRPLAAMAIWFRRRPLASPIHTAALHGLRKISFLTTAITPVYVIGLSFRLESLPRGLCKSQFAGSRRFTRACRRLTNVFLPNSPRQGLKVRKYIPGRRRHATNA